MHIIRSHIALHSKTKQNFENVILHFKLKLNLEQVEWVPSQNEYWILYTHLNVFHIQLSKNKIYDEWGPMVSITCDCNSSLDYNDLCTHSAWWAMMTNSLAQGEVCIQSTQLFKSKESLAPGNLTGGYYTVMRPSCNIPEIPGWRGV